MPSDFSYMDFYIPLGDFDEPQFNLGVFNDFDEPQFNFGVFNDFDQPQFNFGAFNLEEPRNFILPGLGLVLPTGDYVNDDGDYQTLLQNLAERDFGSRRGAPPASVSALKNLENFVIAKNDDNEGKACTICQEIVNIGEVVKKLPCKHIYHDQCITTWLHSRNSCPVCRFELPTDDEEYENKNKKKRRRLE